MITLDGGHAFASLEAFEADVVSRIGCDPNEVPVVVGELPTAPDVLAAVHEHRAGLIGAMTDHVQELETHSRQPLASEHRRFDVLDQRQERVGRFMSDALDAAERHTADQAHIETQRKTFHHIIQGGRPEMQETEFSEWVRHGGSPTFDVRLETHDLTTGGGSAGGVVPGGFVGAFYTHMIAMAAIRQTNTVVYTTSGGEPLKIPKSVTDPIAAQVAEGVAITPGDPSLGSVTLGAYGYKAMTYVSRELVEDSSVDIEEILGRLLGRGIGLASGVQYVTGNGTTAPQGCALTPVAGVTTTWAALIAGATGPDLLTDLYFSVNAPYRPLGYWFMNDSTLAALRKLKSTTNEYLVDRNLVTAPSETIFGRPVVTDPSMATGAGAKDVILFGDFSSYFCLRDVGGVRLERSDDFRFANDEVAFRCVLRTDSKQVLNDTTNAAVKALHDTA